jgi:hypothetical protein
MQRSFVSRWVLIMLLLSGMPWFAPQRVTAQAAIQVLRSEANVDFPRQIEFTLTAESAGAAISSVQLLYGATRSDALTIVDVPVQPGTRVQARQILDTRVYYFPPGTEMTFRWLIRDAAGNLFTSDVQTFLVHDGRHPWSERTAGNLTIFWYRGGERFGDELMTTSQRSLEALQTAFGSTLTDPVRIYVYPSTSDMRSALQSNEVEWVGGQAWPGLGVIIAAIAPDNEAEVRRIIPHEVSHQVLSQATRNPYGGVPLWFDEGLAVWSQETRDRDFDGLISAAARENRLIPLSALAASFPADPAQSRLSYAQSRDVVEYILGVYGTAAVAELITVFREGRTADEAIQTVLQRSVDELDAEWRSTLPPAEVAPTPMPAQVAQAPADRFSDPPLGGGAPIVPPGDQPQPADPFVQDEQDGLLEQIAQLPSVLLLSGLVACTMIATLLAGGILVVVLRRLNADR